MSHDDPRSHPLPGSSEHVSRRVSQCVISFGSNLGERREVLAAAARRVASSSLIESEFRTSRLFETPPIGGPGGQSQFLNAIAAFDTTASAREVLAFLQQVENELGRTRRLRWDARVIDLDVVLHGQLVGGGNSLVVPHPRYTARQFVLQPACDVAAEFQDPRFGWTIAQLTKHLTEGIPSLALVTGELKTRRALCEALADQVSVEVFHDVIDPTDQPWICDHLPDLPKDPRRALPDRCMPRLLVRLHRSTEGSRWPAPHQMWPSGWSWPEYRLEIDDFDWAVSELAAAFESMRCRVDPVSESGDWFERQA
ncbi:MAG: 2-amino-4-hydroxy-6-hydroxymethyldihydropteridine diphosphokinase [Planctomycetota bacterium]